MYKQLLEKVETRTAPQIKLEETIILKPDELEREFLDFFFVVLKSGYSLDEDEFCELVKSIVLANSPMPKQRREQVETFFKHSAALLGFDPSIVKLRDEDSVSFASFANPTFLDSYRLDNDNKQND